MQEAYDKSSKGAASYEAPPLVKWWVLAATVAAISQLADLCLPSRFAEPSYGFAYEVWGLYLCLWIRRINPHAKSIFIMLGVITADIIVIVSGIPPRTKTAASSIIELLAVASSLGIIVATFVMRAELLRHYREREQFPLSLGPFMTFFFGFIYFQYHLYDIAEYKQTEKLASMSR